MNFLLLMYSVIVLKSLYIFLNVSFMTSLPVDNPYMAAPATHPQYGQKWQEKKGEETTKLPASGPGVDEEDQDEEDGSGAGAMNNEVYFVEEYDEEENL